MEYALMVYLTITTLILRVIYKSRFLKLYHKVSKFKFGLLLFN